MDSRASGLKFAGERFGVFGFSLGFRIKVQGLAVYTGN